MGHTKLLLVTPIVGEEFNSRVQSYVESLELPDVKVDCVCLKSGPLSVETMLDEAFAASSMVDEVLHIVQGQSGEPRYRGVVVNCCADPGVHALREALDILVVGAGEASYYTGAMLAPSFSVVSVLRNSVPHVKLRVRSLGLSDRLASVYGIEVGVLDLSSTGIGEEILKAARRAVEQDGADCIVLGCTGMAWLAKQVAQELSVPVVEPTAAALWHAIGLIRQGLTHGRAWMYMRASMNKIVGPRSFPIELGQDKGVL
ncbi:MAG: aspartate/glutamate racemase family protein [Bacillota bacterium]